jgi:hypothetical protein
MKKSKTQPTDQKKRISNRTLAVLAIAVAVIIISGTVVARLFIQTPEPEFSLKATIIDQIGEASPSSPEAAREFNITATSFLKDSGFNVTYIRRENLTVSFYEGLASYDFGLIILRSHSAVRQNGNTVDFFTSEPFNYSKYPSMVDSGLLTQASLSWEPGKSYFAVTPEFVEGLSGYFPKSIVIITGCTSLNSTMTQMAQAFVHRGAKAYIGWTYLVGLAHSDNMILKLLQYFLSSNMTVRAAVDECNRSPDPTYGARLAYFPSDIGSRRLADFVTKGILGISSFDTRSVQQKRRKSLTQYLG